MIARLPYWILTDKYPSIYEGDSKTAVEMVAKVYGKMQELIDDYNKFVDTINLHIEEYESSMNQDYESFKDEINKIVHDYIAMLDEKIKMQDSVIDEAIKYMKDNLVTTIHDLNENNELDNMIVEAISNVEKNLSDKQNDYEQTVNKNIQQLNAQLEVEKNRVDSFTALTEGSTTGDAELTDIRVAYDGKTYDTAGNSVRGQTSELKGLIKDIAGYTIALPNHQNFKVTRNGYETNITATSEVGGALTAVKIDESITKILLNIKLLTFSNAQLFLFYKKTNGDYLNAYKNSTLNCGEEVVEIDWVTVNEYIASQEDCDGNLYFGINVSGVEGSQLITDIVINANTMIDKLNKRIEEVAEQKIHVGKVINEFEMIGTVENSTNKWGTCNISKENNKIYFEFTNESGNAGFFSPGTIMDKFNVLHSDITVDSLSGGLNVYLMGTQKDGNTALLIQKEIRETGNYSIDIDLSYASVYQDLDTSKAVNILIVNSWGVATAIISKFDTYYLENDFEKGKNLSDILEDINNSIIGNVNSDNSTILKSPDGNGYAIQVNSTGGLVSVPVIPNKTLIIGNSLLLGFQTFGMCASDSEHDYYHYLSTCITNKKESATFEKMAGTTFEGATTEATATNWMNNTLLPKLSDELNLVIVQLGDNVNTTEKTAIFENSCKTLLQFIRTNCPNARVCWVGEWYSNTTKQTIIANACKDTGSIFIDITDLVTTENKSAVGNIVTKDDGTTYTVEDSGVASHPGDKGMLAIANRILYKLGITDSENE